MNAGSGSIADRRGFTLLEVLLTSLLAAVVMVALWTLSDIYLKLFAAGSRKIDETKLVRGLTKKLGQDLSQVVQIPTELTFPVTITRGQPGASTLQRVADTSPSREAVSATAVIDNAAQASRRDIPNFGLFGTSDALRLIVLETDPNAAREPTDLADILPQPGQLRTPFAAELKTIEYTFMAHDEGVTDGQRHPPGLVRRKWAWETWVGTRQNLDQGPDSNSDARMMPDSQAPWTAEDVLEFESDTSNVDYAPNVVGLEFHYFDGEEWQMEWNSWEERKLPVLVEVVMRIDTTQNFTRALSSRSAGTSAVSDATTTDDSAITSGTEYRQIIHLPLGDIATPLEQPIRDSTSDNVATTNPRQPTLPMSDSAATGSRSQGRRRP